MNERLQAISKLAPDVVKALADASRRNSSAFQQLSDNSVRILIGFVDTLIYICKILFNVFRVLCVFRAERFMMFVPHLQWRQLEHILIQMMLSLKWLVTVRISIWTAKMAACLFCIIQALQVLKALIELHLHCLIVMIR